MKQRFFGTFLLVLTLLGACKSLQEKGTEQYLSGQYQYAIGTFSQILEEDPDNLEANEIVAESYRLSNRIENSAPYYQKLVEEDPSFNRYFFLGQSLKHNRKQRKPKRLLKMLKPTHKMKLFWQGFSENWKPSN